MGRVVATAKDREAILRIIGVEPKEVPALLGFDSFDFVTFSVSGDEVTVRAAGVEHIWTAERVFVGGTGRNGLGGTATVVKHTGFEVSKAARGQGIATGIIEREVEALRGAGFDKISLRAAREMESAFRGMVDQQGYFVWPRLGFDAEVPKYKLAGIARTAKLYPDLDLGPLASQVAAHPPDKPFLLSDLLQTPGGRRFWREQGATIDTSFDLAPESRSSKVLSAYLAEKRPPPPPPTPPPAPMEPTTPPLRAKPIRAVRVRPERANDLLARNRDFAGTWTRNTSPMRARLRALEREVMGLAERGTTYKPAEVDAMVARAMDDVERLLEARRISSANRAVAALVQHANSELVPTSREMRRGIARLAAEKSLKDEFDGFTISDIMRVYRRRVQRQVRAALKAKDLETMESMLRHGLGGVHGVRSPYPGGTAARSLRTIFVTEQSRAAKHAEDEFFARQGARLAYWRLSARHPNYGGKEICERMAENVNPDVVTYLAENGLRLDPHGLYFVGSIPYAPHPNCLCYREPVYR